MRIPLRVLVCLINRVQQEQEKWIIKAHKRASVIYEGHEEFSIERTALIFYR